MALLRSLKRLLVFFSVTLIAITLLYRTRIATIAPIQATAKLNSKLGGEERLAFSVPHAKGRKNMTSLFIWGDDRSYNVTWPCFIPGQRGISSSSSSSSSSKNKSASGVTTQRCYYVKADLPMEGRLGNRMFLYASLLGFARKTNRIPLLGRESHLRTEFRISTRTPQEERVGQLQISTWGKYVDFSANKFDPRLMRLPTSGNLHMKGYFQSWKYFDAIRSFIRKEFAFLDHIEEAAKVFLHSSAASEFRGQDVTFIGVHVRRGDMLTYADRGYTVADDMYLHRAVKHFHGISAISGNILYVICSDSINWTKQHLPPLSDREKLVFSENHPAIVDLAILSRCNHTIQTVGTFGWWAAYMSGGKSVYYKDFPRPKSTIGRHFLAKDHFLEDWTGL